MDKKTLVNRLEIFISELRKKINVTYITLKETSVPNFYHLLVSADWGKTGSDFDKIKLVNKVLFETTENTDRFYIRGIIVYDTKEELVDYVQDSIQKYQVRSEWEGFDNTSERTDLFPLEFALK